MGVFDLLRRWRRRDEARRMNDPDFGRIVYCGGGLWQSSGDGGTRFREDLPPVTCSVPGTERGPGDSARGDFRELRSRYDRLSHGVARLLSAHFSSGSSSDAREPSLPDLTKPAKFLANARLLSIAVTEEPDGAQPSFQLTYSVGEDDHSYDVRIRRWYVDGLDVHG